MKKTALFLLVLCLLASILILPASAEQSSPFSEFTLEEVFMMKQLIDMEITIRLSKGETASWFDYGLGAELPTPINEKFKALSVVGTPMNTDSSFYAVVQMESWDIDIFLWKLQNYCGYEMLTDISGLVIYQAKKDNITVTITVDDSTMTIQAERK